MDPTGPRAAADLLHFCDLFGSRDKLRTQTCAARPDDVTSQRWQRWHHLGLVNIQKTMENHHFYWDNSIFLMAMFNSYVSLPEGTMGKWWRYNGSEWLGKIVWYELIWTEIKWSETCYDMIKIGISPTRWSIQNSFMAIYGYLHGDLTNNEAIKATITGIFHGDIMGSP